MKRVVENAIESDVLRITLAWALLGGCIFSAMFYAYLVNKAIFQTVQTKHLTTTMRDLSSKLNTLEQQYLSLENSTTLQRALELGFTESSNPKFVSRKSLGKGLSLRDEL